MLVMWFVAHAVPYILIAFGGSGLMATMGSLHWQVNDVCQYDMHAGPDSSSAWV
jgi:hypothetical protein